MRQALGGKDVLDLTGAHAEGQCAECAVRGSVAISADDGEAGLKLMPSSGPMDVHDTLIAAVHVKEANAAVSAQLRTRASNCAEGKVGIEDGEQAVLGGDGMVHDGEGQFGAANFAAGGFESRECLRGSALVNEMPVNIKESGLLRVPR